MDGSVGGCAGRAEWIRFPGSETDEGQDSTGLIHHVRTVPW